MARIRTVKPEFPQSETIGKLSRDARLLFIQLWTICDDVGRARAASRMLASLLYPYDDDAAKLMPRWLKELEAAGCIRLYEVDGSHYLDIPKWLSHQKIDHPSKSRLPSFDEASRNLASDSEILASDLGPVPVPRTKEEDQRDFAKGEEEIAFDQFAKAAEENHWPTPSKLSDDRRKKLRARLEEHGREGWAAMLERAKASQFLKTEFPLKLDWVLEPKNFLKVIEGNYDQRAGPSPGREPMQL